MRALRWILVLALIALAAGAAWVVRELWRFELPEQGAAPPGAVTPEQGPTVAAAPAAAGASAARAAAGERNAEAIALLEAGELEEAVRLFEQCVAGEPDEPVFARNLAEALARLARREHGAAEPQRRERARALLARAVELDRERADLAALLERWRTEAEAEDGFWRELTAHFELSFDGTRAELLHGTAPLERELEDAYLELGELFGHFPVEAGRPRIRVLLHRKEDFDRVTGLGDWAGGVFDGTVRVSVEDLAREGPALRRTLRHELVHAFADAVGGSAVPAWLNEGLAQWLEVRELAARAAALARARERLVGEALFPLAELEGGISSWTDRDAIARAYAQSLAFVAHLLRAYGERLVFEMVAASAGEGARACFERRVGLSLEVALEDLAQGL